MLQHPADLVHLSKPRLPAVVIGLHYKLLWGATVLVDIDDEELCFAGEREPITLDGLKRLWTRLAVALAQRFDGITTANRRGRQVDNWINSSRRRQVMKPVEWVWVGAARVSSDPQEPHELQPYQCVGFSCRALSSRPSSLLGL